MRQVQARLRDSTRAAHHGIDHHPLLAPLVKPGLSLEHYQYVLLAMHWIHVPLLESLVAGLDEFIPDSHFRPSNRPNWLAEDFDWFEMNETMASESFTEHFQPRFTSAESLVGALYVIEGSTLGGQVITRQLAESIEVYPGKGASFFHGHGANTQLHWSDFWRFASEVCTKGSMDEVCTSAVRMFGDLENALNICAERGM